MLSPDLETLPTNITEETHDKMAHPPNERPPEAKSKKPMYYVGQTKITDFGAVVDLGDIETLLHISEISWSRIRDVSDVLSIGDSIEVKVA